MRPSCWRRTSGRRAWWTALVMLVGIANCGHSCGQSKEDYDATPCTNLQEGAYCRGVTSERCEEKVHANPECNVIWDCALNDTWKREPPKKECKTTCPAAFTQTLPGACEGVSDTTASPLCEYPEGICGCSKAKEWKCVSRSVQGGKLSECPSIRPAGGAKRCPSDEHWPESELVCGYGDAELLGAVSAACRHYSWTLSNQREDSALGR